jgi:hypothetical protein
MTKLWKVVALVAVLTLASAAFAATQGNASPLQTTVQVSANVQQAIRLTLTQGSVLANHCAISAGATTDYAMNFGTVDALGISTPTCGAQFAPTTPGVTPAVYYSDYTLNPVFTGFPVNAGTITAYVSDDFDGVAGSTKTLEVWSAGTNGGAVALTNFNPMSTAAASPTSVAAAVASNSALNRYIGVAVQPLNGAGLQTVGNATVTFTLTVE